MPKVGGRRKKVRSHKQTDEVQQKLIPKTFILKKGKCSQPCKELSLDIRKCFYPNTAMKLENSNKLAIKSYIKAAQYYRVSHLIVFQQSAKKTFARFIKVGGGEITFRVLNYCRMKDLVNNGGQPFSYSFRQPLIVLNNFKENNQVRQIGRSIQQLFPALNIDKVRLQNIKRVMSFTYQTNKKCIYFRHYRVMLSEGGVNDGFRQLLKGGDKDISEYRTFADYLNKQENKEYGSNENQQQVKLVEIGPRMKLRFIGFKEGFGKMTDDDEYAIDNQQPGADNQQPAQANQMQQQNEQ